MWCCRTARTLEDGAAAGGLRTVRAAKANRAGAGGPVDEAEVDTAVRHRAERTKASTGADATGE